VLLAVDVGLAVGLGKPLGVLVGVTLGVGVGVVAATAAETPTASVVTALSATTARRNRELRSRGGTGTDMD
jgi:hypothetical protein